MTTKTLGLAGLVAIAWAARAPAAVLSFEYTGHVFTVNSYFDTIVDVGDPVTGTFRVDSEAVDTDPDPTVAVYEGATQTFTMGSYGVVSIPAVVRITNDPAFDAYEVIHYGSDLPPVGGNPVVQQSVSIFGGPGLLSDTALGPPPPLDAPAIQEAYLRLGALPEGLGVTYQYGDLETLPEVGGAGAAIGALLGAALLRRTPNRPESRRVKKSHL